MRDEKTLHDYMESIQSRLKQARILIRKAHGDLKQARALEEAEGLEGWDWVLENHIVFVKTQMGSALQALDCCRQSSGE